MSLYNYKKGRGIGFNRRNGSIFNINIMHKVFQDFIKYIMYTDYAMEQKKWILKKL